MLDEVLETHERAGILIKPSKTFLFQKHVHYLGHDLSAAGISMIDEYRSPHILDGPSKKEMEETAEFDQYVCAVNHRSEVNFEDWVDLNLIEQDEEVVLPPVTVPGQVSIPDWILRQDEDEDLKLVKKWVKDQVKPPKEEIHMKP